MQDEGKPLGTAGDAARKVETRVPLLQDEGKTLGTAGDAARKVETRVPFLLSVAQNAHKNPQVRLEALNELSSVLVSGRRDYELSTAVVTAGW